MEDLWRIKFEALKEEYIKTQINHDLYVSHLKMGRRDDDWGWSHEYDAAEKRLRPRLEKNVQGTCDYAVNKYHEEKTKQQEQKKETLHVCTWSADFTSIKAAVEAANAKLPDVVCTILVQPGEYIEENPIRVGSGISIMSTRGASNTIIKAKNQEEELIIPDGKIRIEGFNLDGKTEELMKSIQVDTPRDLRYEVEVLQTALRLEKSKVVGLMADKERYSKMVSNMAQLRSKLNEIHKLSKE